MIATIALRVVLVGFGPVGARLVEGLLPDVRSGAVRLTVVGAESVEAYNRVLVAEYAVGRADRDGMVVTDAAAAEAAGVRLALGVTVTAIDRARQTVTLSDGTVEAYDRVVLATGARANVPTLYGVDRPTPSRSAPARAAELLDTGTTPLPAGITVLRDLADAERVQEAVRKRRRIVVLGAGVLGLELALASAAEGADVCVVHHGEIPMARNLDRGGGLVLARALARAGVSVVAHSRAEGVGFRLTAEGTPTFDAVLCADGKSIAGDLLVLSCGVSARTELAHLAGLPVSTGILVDRRLRSWGDDAISAIGDCAHVVERPDAVGSGAFAVPPGAPSGLIGPGWRQADWLARSISAEAVSAAEPEPLADERAGVVMLKAEDVDVVAVGSAFPDPWDAEPIDVRNGRPARQVSQWADPEHGSYVKLVTRGGVLEGLVCIGMPRTAAELTLLFERGSELPADRSVLLRHDGPDATPASASAASAPEATVCWCNGVTVGHVHDSVRDGAETVACVSAATRAGTGCGGCKGRIAELLDLFASTDGTQEVVV
ncbi:FAD-dependent oxidoreductase [Planctomonas psychrotolerans]|uniref:FAD-dependent oxidoreductase n=1 Tax=Planctomonas psychrotolerans TaxID=2528712 RepID=UPI001D0D7E12|nr:FAD-dependent oxidoreductase [Planctomonas psychrotolerans]